MCNIIGKYQTFLLSAKTKNYFQLYYIEIIMFFEHSHQLILNTSYNLVYE